MGYPRGGVRSDGRRHPPRHAMAALLTLALLAACQGRPAEDRRADATGADEVPLGRLPEGVRPTRYALELTIDPRREGFEGEVTIGVELAERRRGLWLHGRGLDVRRAALVTADGSRIAARYEQVDAIGVARLTLARPAPAGAARLELAFSGRYRRGNEGLYVSEVGSERYVFSQFQPIDARRLFPGFDEPRFKTPFEVTVTAPADATVVGNAPIVATEPAAEGMKRVELAPTPPLPTYLLAFAVGPLDVVEWDPVPPSHARSRPLRLRGIATRGQGERLSFALANTAAILLWLEEYFASPYPYRKLDLIASPEAGFSAMENAGAIVYGDPLLLLDDAPPIRQQRNYGSVHAHELAHQWFGNLVTPRWWDDLWLNESFASWLGAKAADAWRPELETGSEVLEGALRAMRVDSRVHARRIHEPVERSGEIAAAFDAITYEKGAGVLAMFERYVGPDAFRAGIRTHVERFADGAADAAEFMRSLADGSGRPEIVPAFESFIERPGVPLVEVTARCDDAGARLELSQRRYLPLGSAGSPAARWRIPTCLAWSADGERAERCLLLDATRASQALPACPDWVMPNADGAGYYRFELGTEGFARTLLASGRLTERETLALADSFDAALRAGRLDAGDYLDAVPRIARAPWPPTATEPLPTLETLLEDVATRAQRERLAARLAPAYRERFEALGLDAGPADERRPVRAATLRGALGRFLALTAREPLVREALAERGVALVRHGEAEGGVDEGAVHPTLATTAMAVAVQVHGAPYVETLVERLTASDDGFFRSQAARALGRVATPELGERVRALMLTPKLRGGEMFALAAALADNPAQREATFEWLVEHLDALAERLPFFALERLPRLAAGFCSEAAADRVRVALAPRAEPFGFERTLARTVEDIELCAVRAQALAPQLARWLEGGPG